MTTFNRLVILAVPLLTAAVSLLQAQSADDWTRVMSVESGRRVQVQMKAKPGEKLKDEFRSSTAVDLTLVDKSGAVHVYQRADIARVRLRRSDVAPTAGAITGAIWGGMVLGISDGSGGQKAASFVILTAFGWLVGKAIQRGPWKTIYVAP